MTDRTITLDSELVERLEKIAEAQRRTVEDVVSEMLQQYAPRRGNWALAVAEGMEAADIEWVDEPDASERSSERFQQHLSERWQRSQRSDDEDA